MNATLIETIGNYMIVKSDQNLFAAINRDDHDDIEHFTRARDARDYALQQVDVVDVLAALSQ